MFSVFFDGELVVVTEKEEETAIRNLMESFNEEPKMFEGIKNVMCFPYRTSLPSGNVYYRGRIAYNQIHNVLALLSGAQKDNHQGFCVEFSPAVEINDERITEIFVFFSDGLVMVSETFTKQGW